MLGSAYIPRVRDWPAECNGHNWFGQRIWGWHRSLGQEGFWLEMAELGVGECVLNRHLKTSFRLTPPSILLWKYSHCCKFVVEPSGSIFTCM